MQNGVIQALVPVPAPVLGDPTIQAGVAIEAKVPSVTPLVQMFEDAEEATREARKRAERDRDYYDDKQWTEEEANVLRRRGQPVVQYNRIKRKIDFLSGLEKQQRKDPKAFPRNPKDQEAADAATDAIRYVCDDTDWDAVRSAAWDDLLIEGTGAVFVGHKETRNGVDPALSHVPWDRLFHDPHSRKPDFADAAYMGIVTWWDLADAIRKWPEGEDYLNGTWEADKHMDTFDDKPRHGLWSDYRRKRVRTVEVYYQERGEWTRAVITKSGFLELPEPSPYLDEDGRPENPIKAVSLYVNRENERYGCVRVMIDPQDEVNKRRSKALHLMMMRQVRVSPASGMDAEDVRREGAKPDGVFTGERDDFDFLPTGDQVQGNLEMLQEAKNEIDLLGANAALAGKNESDMSGRAIMAQQQGGMVEVARMFDRLRVLSIATYRGVWNRIRQMWQQERWVRVTDTENNLRFVGLNQQVSLSQLAQEVMEGDEHALEVAQSLVNPQIIQAAMQGDEQAQAMLGQFVQMYGQEIVETRNAVNELDVDIVIDEGLDTPSVQAEQFDMLVKMLPGLGPLGQSPQVLELLVEASSLRNKDRLLEMLRQGPSPEQVAQEQQQQQIQMAGAVAQVEKVQSETQRNLAQAATAGAVQADPVEQSFRAAEIETDQFEAVTNRIQALQPDVRAAA